MLNTSGFDKRTLRQRCAAYVREAIIAGRFEPGEHLVETFLAEELGVSRGTLREALRSLESEGLVTHDGRGHMLVRSITAKEISEVFLVRGALEVLAATTLAARDDHAQVGERLRSALEPLQGQLDFGDRIAADLRFHETLCRETGNATLLTAWRQLIGQIEMMIIAAGPETAMDRMRYDEHVGIADAIVDGDAEQAREVVTAHMATFAHLYSKELI